MTGRRNPDAAGHLHQEMARAKAPPLINILALSLPAASEILRTIIGGRVLDCPKGGGPSGFRPSASSKICCEPGRQFLERECPPDIAER
jgi:hypothetical protein